MTVRDLGVAGSPVPPTWQPDAALWHRQVRLGGVDPPHPPRRPGNLGAG